jgi:hypothetical protein
LNEFPIGFQGYGFFGKEVMPLQVTYADPRGVIPVWDEREEFFGNIPIRTEITVLGPDLRNGQIWVRDEREEV